MTSAQWKAAVGWYDAAVAEVYAHRDPKGEVVKDERLTPAREALAEAAAGFDEFAPTNHAQAVDRLHNLAWVAAWQTWIARTLGQAQGHAAAGLAYLTDLRALDATAAAKLEYLSPRFRAVLDTPGPKADLAPAWGANFLTAPRTRKALWLWWIGGGLLWLLRR